MQTIAIVVGVLFAIFFIVLLVWAFAHRSSQQNALADLKMKENPSLHRHEAMALAELDIMRATPPPIYR